MSQNTAKRFDGIYRATISAVVKTWQNSPWRRPILILVILGTIFGSSAFFYSNPEPASALVQPAGRLYYGDQTNSAMRFQTNTFDFTFNGESSFTHGASASLIAHTVVKTAPTRDEVMVGQLKVDGQLHVIRGINGYDVNTDYSLAWTNSGTTGTQTCAGTTEVDCTRAFDVTYERLSGRSMVVYADNTNQKLYYCYFDGTNWGPVSNCAPTNGSNDITLSSNGRPTFVSLKAKGGTNEILMGVSIDVSGTHEVEAYRWDGDSWENQLVATDTTNAATTGLESGVIFDVEWESNSGDGMVVWASSAGNGATVYRLFTGGSWGSDQTGPTSVGSNGTPHTVQLEADPVSNRIGYVYTDSLNDSAPGVWKADGTTAGWTMGNEDAGLEATEPGVVLADIKWERFTSTLMWVAQTGGTTVDTEYQTATCDGSGCTFSSIDTTIPTAGGDDGNFVRLADSPNSDDIMFLWSHHDRDLYAQHWDGSAWEAAASASLEADVSPGTSDNTNFHGISAAFVYIPYNPWQRNWRFFDDETVNEPSTGLNGAAENATPTGVDPEEFIRLRINVFNPQPQAQTDARKKLQYASGCDPNSSETACTWSDVGGSTNIFSGASSATVTVTRVVTGAAITSTTHPDPAKWYKAKDASLTWTKPAGAASYSYTLSHDDDQPSKSGSGTATSANFSELADGIWTFSLVTTFSDGKTASSSYTIRVDTTPPAKFEFTTERKNGSTDPFPIISFTTTDTPSGIERYEVIVDSNEPISTTENTIKLPKQRPGKHTIIIRAIDKAGNSTDSVGSFNVDGFAGPIITDYPSIVSIFQKIKLTGTALYGAKVQLYIGGIAVEEFIVKDHLSDDQKKSPEIATVTDDSTVEWTYEMKNGQLPGYRLLYATQTKTDGAESNQSNQVKFLVAPDSVNVLGVNVPLLLIVFLLLIVLVVAGAFIVIGYRRVRGVVVKRRKNNEELERIVKEKMDGLQHDLERRISHITKNPGKVIKGEINVIEDEIIEEIEKSG